MGSQSSGIASGVLGRVPRSVVLDPLPGEEIGYSERQTTFTSTNVDPANPDEITGVSVTAIGTGRPVQIEFYAPQIRHSVASARVRTTLLINGALGQGSWANVSPTATTSVSGLTSYRMVLTAGTSYTFEVGTYTPDAGTISYVASVGIVAVMFLAVTQR